jgi:tagatose-1,6-bisphosphate aldolase
MVRKRPGIEKKGREETMQKRELSIGKLRGLQQCSSEAGAISVLALDHRNNLRNAMNPDDPGTVSDADLMKFKQDVVRVVAPAATAVLLDPEFGAAQAIAARALPGQIGLLSAVEATGYVGDPNARSTQLLPDWSVAKAARMGANAIKMLVYYHPDSPSAGEIEQLVRQVGDDCIKADLPLFVEPLSYSPDPLVKKISPEERRRVVLETARRLTPLGMDILKAEFPVDVQAVSDQAEWGRACAELTQASQVPWVLLSASVAYDTYLRQVRIACEQGASGVAVGRAVWQEGPRLRGGELQSYLSEVARPRMARLKAVCDGLAAPWFDVYSGPSLAADWYVNYKD